MTTIIFEEVTPEKYNPRYSNLDTCIHRKKFFNNKFDTILKMSESEPQFNLSLPSLGNGLLGTIYNAYSQHVPLVLRPDDIWIAIITSFGNYVKNHSEEMRNCFVDHAGRKELVINVLSPMIEHVTDKHWTEFIALMTDEIKVNTKSEIVQWMIPTFSTTTQTDVTISHIALMGTVSEYFSFRMELCCGLSKVILEGTLDDWIALQTKCNKLYDFGIRDLSDWADLLISVLDEFINSFQQKVDKDFWQRICTNKTRGSGGQLNFRGWFLVFAPFNAKGKYILRSAELIAKDNIYAIVDDDDIVDCAIDVQVTINDHGKMHQAVFYAGLLMTKYDWTTGELSPYAAWIMVQKKHIVYEDLLMYFNTKTVIKKEEEDLAHLHDLLKFSYHVAISCNFPNDKLITFVDTCTSYYWNYGRHDSNKHNGCDYGKYLSWLAETIHFSHRPNMFAKYIDMAKINDILKSYQK